MERRIVIEGIPLTTKASVGSISTLAFDASHEARRRMAAFSIQLTRKPYRTSEPRGLSPSGGIFAANSHVSLAPARLRRAVRGQGILPLARGPSPSGGISQPTHMSLYTPARRRRAVRGQGVLPLARGPSPSGGISQSTHMSPYAPARPRRSPGSRGTTPCARPVAERRYLRSQLTCLPMPLRAVGAQSERGTQSPILPRTMKRAPSKV